MKNPMNSLHSELQIRIKNLSDTTKELTSLKKEYNKLIEESVKVENDNVLLRNSVEFMCGSCIKKGTNYCEDCALHETAIKLDLWR